MVQIETARMKYNLKVADLFFKVDSIYDSHTSEMFADYIIDDDACPTDAYRVECVLTQDELSEPTGKRLTKREECNWYTDGVGKYTLSFYDSSNECICALMNYDNSAGEARIVLRDVKTLYGVDTEYFLYNIMERLFRLVLIFNGGFAVHASSIVHEGYGLAFSAESGTGKSTHTGLWLKNYPGTYILNDDGPAMRLINGEWYIYGTPWAGTTGINTNACVPLKSLVFLERNKVNKIRECSALESIPRLFEAIIHPTSDEIINLLFATVSSFLTMTKVCVLGCNISDEAPKVVKKYLY